MSRYFDPQAMDFKTLKKLRKTAMCKKGDQCYHYLMLRDCKFAHSVEERRCRDFAVFGSCRKATCARKHTHIDAVPTVEYSKFRDLKFATTGDRPDDVQCQFVRSLPKLTSCVDRKLLDNVADSAKAAHTKKGQYGLKFLDDKYIIIRWSLNKNSPKLALREAWEDDTKARQLLKDLLQVEVAQSISDIRQYDIEDAVLEPEMMKRRLMYRINCDGLAEKRPSVLRQDRVKVRDNQTMKWHEGFVWFVNLDHVLVSFGKKFVPTDKSTFLVIFSVPLTNYRKQFDALGRVPILTTQFLKSNKMASPTALEPLTPVTPLARKLNQLQLAAVRRIVQPCVRGKLGLFILHGPPGTGKTTTVVAAIAEMLSSNKPKPGFRPATPLRILVSTPSNEAANLVIERLAGIPNLLARGVHLRVVGFNLDVAKECSSQVQKFTRFPYDLTDDSVELMVTTMMTAGTVFSLGYDPGYFDHIIVDEAGQATETELMVPLCFASPKHGTRITLAGDHKQLGPILRSVACQGRDFAKSTLQRLMGVKDIAESFSLQLVDSYRAHPTILDLYNTLTYEGSLIARAPKAERELLVGSRLLPNPQHPIAFYHVEGKEDRQLDSPSWFNDKEATAVIDLIDNLLCVKGIAFEDIVVLAPYTKQGKYIRDRLHHQRFDRVRSTRDLYYCPNYQRSLMPIRVCSVETFQGREAKVVILTCVRSKSLEVVGMDQRQGIGFLKQPQRLNVAISRPISALFIVGNAATLCSDENWEELLQLMRCNYNAVCQPVAQSSAVTPMTIQAWGAIEMAALRLRQAQKKKQQEADPNASVSLMTSATVNGETVAMPAVDPEWGRIE